MAAVSATSGGAGVTPVTPQEGAATVIAMEAGTLAIRAGVEGSESAMRSIIRTSLVSVAATGMLAAGGLTASAGAAAPVNVGNLVNVNVSNVLNNNDVDVTVPINAAANICGVDVDVLVLATAPTGDQTVDCEARGNQQVTVTG